MDEYLSFVTIDVWTLIFTWVNLIILFFLLKKFLFKPVNKMLKERADEIENTYRAAETAAENALQMKSEYGAKLAAADEEVGGIIKTAVENAGRRGAEIVRDACDEAERVTQRSLKKIELEREDVMNSVRAEAASIAADIAEKLIGEALEDKDKDDKLINDIIGRI